MNFWLLIGCNILLLFSTECILQICAANFFKPNNVLIPGYGIKFQSVIVKWQNRRRYIISTCCGNFKSFSTICKPSSTTSNVNTDATTLQTDGETQEVTVTNGNTDLPTTLTTDVSTLAPSTSTQTVVTITLPTEVTSQTAIETVTPNVVTTTIFSTITTLTQAITTSVATLKQTIVTTAGQSTTVKTTAGQSTTVKTTTGPSTTVTTTVGPSTTTTVKKATLNPCCPTFACTPDPKKFDAAGNLKFPSQYGTWKVITYAKGQSRNYMFGTVISTRDDAWRFCCSIGMDLVTPNSNAEMTALELNGPKTDNFWTTGSSTNCKGNPVWCPKLFNETSTRLSAQLIPWDAYGQNDDGTQQCINMRFRATLTLNDWHCDDVKTARDESAALCEGLTTLAPAKG